MDKLLDRLGIYDLFGVLIPGFISLFSILYYLGFCDIVLWKNLFNNKIGVDKVVVSYLIGNILNVLGHTLERKHSKKSLYKYLDQDNKIFSSFEKSIYRDVLKEVMNISGEIKEEESDYFYCYCYECLSAWGKSAKADMFESLCGMNRSLYVFYLLAFGFLFIIEICIKRVKIQKKLIVLVLVAILAYTFRKREIRFKESRIKVTLRTYVSVLSEKKKIKI